MKKPLEQFWMDNESGRISDIEMPNSTAVVRQPYICAEVYYSVDSHCRYAETGRVEHIWAEDLVTAMVRSGDYSITEAILTVAIACEKCQNVLAHKYGLLWGYSIYSDDYKESEDICELCEDED